ncbi:hypothetical protein [Caudoviricetes sp.]|nr:hypothetical protein [Caudoviricetes sp.]
MKALDIITSEIHEYMFGVTHIDENIPYSEYKLKKRIQLFKNKYYPTGKITEDGDYEHWFDIIHPTVNSEVKNIDFDSKHFLIFSTAPIQDFAAVYVMNLSVDEYMWNNGTAEELNATVEDYSADGNVLFRKTSDGYEMCDMPNTFIVNQTARTVDDTDIIERFYMSQSDLREKGTLFKNVDEVIKNCGDVFFSRTEKGVGEIRSKKLYEIYRRTGEISERDLFQAQGKKGGDENKYVLARIVAAGLKKGKSSNRYILFAEEMAGKMSDYFIEAHRGPYKGKWWREGLYELGFDHQVRFNDISNDIARGLAWAGKVMFSHSDKLTLQNLRTQLKNGSLIKSADIRQLSVVMQGFEQLVADRNSILQQWNDIANSYEVVQGKNMPAQTAFRAVATIDVNATKLFVFLRQKLTLAYKQVFFKFVMPNLVKEMTMKDIIRVTGDPTFIDRFRRIAVDSWYINNLVQIGPHTNEMAIFIKDAKFAEFQQTEPLIENVKEIWKGVLPRLRVTITGENYLTEEVQTISELIAYEQDPVRKAFLLDMIYAAKGIPVPPAVSMEALQSAGSSGEGPLKPKGDMMDVPQNAKEPVTA